MIRIRLAGLLSLILISPGPAADTGAAARDLLCFLRLIGGEFDNFQQVYEKGNPRIGIKVGWIQTGLVREGSK